MAVPVAGTVTAFTSNSGTTVTQSFVSTGFPLYVVVTDRQGTATACTFSGTSLTRVANRSDAAGVAYGETVWFLATHAAETANIVITLDADRAVSCAAFNVTGGPPDGAVQVITSFAASETTSSALVMPAYGTNSLVFGIAAAQSTVTTSDASTVQWHQTAGNFRSTGGTFTGGALKTFTWSQAGTFEVLRFGFAIPDGTQVVSGGTTQLWLGTNTTAGGNGPYYSGLPAGRAFVVTEDWAEAFIQEAGTIRGMNVTQVTVPGGGKTDTYTLTKNELATALTVTVGATETSKSVSADVVIYPWDRIGWTHTGTGAPANVVFSYSLEFESAVSGVSVYAGGAENAGTTTGTISYQQCYFPMLNWLTSTPRWHEGLSGAAGTITQYSVQLPYSLRAADVIDCYLYKVAAGGTSAVKQDGTGGTPNTHISIPFTAGDYDRPTRRATFSLPVVVGDGIYCECTLTNTTGSDIIRPALSMSLTATTAGEYTLGGGVSNVTPASATYFAPVTSDDTYTVTEATHYIMIGPLTQAFQVTGLVWKIETAPGANKSWTLSTRQNAASPSGVVSSTLSGTTKYGTATGSLAYVEGDTLDMMIVPASTPTVPDATIWALRGYSPTVTPTEEVQYIRRERVFPLPSSPDNKWMFIRWIEFILQPGVGITTGFGSDPQVMFSISRDGGNRYGIERWASAGKIGEYTRRVRFVNCGRYRNGTGKIIVDAPVPWIFIACEADIVEGIS